MGFNIHEETDRKFIEELKAIERIYPSGCITVEWEEDIDLLEGESLHDSYMRWFHELRMRNDAAL